MNLLSLRKPLSAVLLLVLLYSTSALAAATVTVTASGDSSYSIQGSGMDGVAGIQLDINYDATSLSSPTVTKGAVISGAMLAANTTRPGSIRVAIISTNAFSGSGQIASLSFAGKTGTGGVTSATVSMIDLKGAAIAASVTVPGSSGSSIAELSNTPGVPFSQASETIPTAQPSQSQTTSTTQTSSTGVTTSLGTVTLPTDQGQVVTTVQPPPSPAIPGYVADPPASRTAEQAQPTVPAAIVKPEETPQYVTYKEILDRFRRYNGSKKLAAVSALFDKKISQTIQQSPAIVLSNGKDKALLTIDIPARIKTSPNFAVHGGTLVSFQQEKQQNGRWMVEVLPENGTLKATVTILAAAEEFEYPLTVAPPVKTALTLDEKGWDQFIAETGTTQAPLHDFNADGIRDYIDEYIFAANIIAKKSAPEKPTTNEQPVKPAKPTPPPPPTPPKSGK